MSVENPASSAPGGGKTDGKSNRRRSVRSKRRNRNKPSEESAPPRPASVSAEPLDKAQRERRERRRRRRMKTKQRGQTDDAPARVVEDIMKDLPSLQPVFVYTHVIRPSVRDSYEFRTDHFAKVTRRLEDFNIDLAPFFSSLAEDDARLAARSRAEAAGIDLRADLDGDWDDDWDEDDGENTDDAEDNAGPAMHAGDDDPVDLDPTDNDDELN